MATRESRDAIQKAEKWMIEFIPKRISEMFNTNIELITYMKLYNNKVYDHSVVKYWINEIIKNYEGKETFEQISGSDYEYTLLSFIRLIDIYDYDEYSEWSKKAIRKIYTDYYLYNQSPGILFYLRNNIIKEDLVFKTLLQDNVGNVDKYSSTINIAEFIITVVACDMLEIYQTELEFAKHELISRQNDNGSWYNKTFFLKEADTKELKKGNLFATYFVIHALSLLEKKRKHYLIRARNWIISQQDKDGYWASPNGYDVGLFTVLSIESINLINNKNTSFFQIGGFNYMSRIKKEKYDVFISHASVDKLDYVEDLVKKIYALGINVFYDKDTFSWGDNWKDLIIRGTGNSEFAIIIISENFFGREWTEAELKSFLELQNQSGQKIVLPLLHNITFEQFSDAYPELKYIHAITTQEKSVEEITLLLAKELIKRYKNNN